MMDKRILLVKKSSDVPSALKYLNYPSNDEMVIDLETYDDEEKPTLNPFTGHIKILAVYNPVVDAIVIFFTSASWKEGELIRDLYDFLSVSKFVMANAKYEYKWILHKSCTYMKKPIHLKIVDDVIVLGRLIDNRLPAGLKPRACLELNIVSWEVNFYNCSDDELIEYAAKDVYYTHKLKEALYKKFNSIDFLSPKSYSW